MGSMEKSGSDFTINRSSFPGKLWSLVNDPQITSVCWDPCGEGVLIYENSFEAEVLKPHTRLKKTHFKTSTFSSFIRQMNLYGFKKVRPAIDILSEVLSVCLNMGQPHHFQNPNFKEVKPELLVHIKRLTHTNKNVPDVEVPSPSSRRMNYARAIKSLKEKSAEMSNGSLFVEPLITPHQSGPQPCDRIPESSYELVASHCGPSPLNVYANHVVPLSGFCHVPADTHVSSPVLVEQGIMPHDSQNRVHSPVYHCDPDFMNLEVPFDQPLAASYPPYSYYPESSVGYFPHTDGNPDWDSGYVPDPWQSDFDIDLDTLLQMEEELQESSVSYIPGSDGNPDRNSVPDPCQRDLDMDLDTLLQMAEDLQDVTEGGTDMSNDLEKILEEFF